MSKYEADETGIEEEDGMCKDCGLPKWDCRCFEDGSGSEYDM